MGTRMKLGTKLILTYLAVGLLPLILVGVVAYVIAAGALEAGAYSQLESMRQMKEQQVQGYFAEREGDLNSLVDNVMMLEQQAFDRVRAVQNLKKVRVEELFVRMSNDIETLARTKAAEVAFTDFAKYEKEAGLDPDGGLDMKAKALEEINAKTTPNLSGYVTVFGYYDVFLIDKSGRCFWTQFKESDLGENLRTGRLKDEGLGDVFEKAMAAEGDLIVYDDFRPYSPSAGAQAAFAAKKYRNAAGEVVGVVALQLPDKPINDIVQDRTAMGETGETYLVGRAMDKTSFRSNMLTMGDGKYVIGYGITTEYIEEALAGKSGQEVYTDSKGKLVLVCFDPLKLKGLEWAMVTKIDLQEAIAEEYAGERRVKEPQWANDYYSAYIEKYGYYDLFLIHPQGQVFYSVTHEADFGTNMITGPYKDSGLGKVVREVLEKKTFAFADFEPYAPSNGDPAAFIAHPIVHNGEVEMIVALQLSASAINKMASVGSDPDRDLEAYLVGPDHLMRSDSVLNPDEFSVKANFKNKKSVKTVATEAAFRGESGHSIIEDYNGESVLSAYAPVTVFDTQWALLCEIDERTAFAANIVLAEWCGGIGVLTGVIVVLIAIFMARGISGPISKIIMDLTGGANEVAAASGQISQASQALAEGATEQAASLEESSSALEEMASMSRQNADNAGRADTMMRESREQIEGGAEAVQNMSSAMNEINDSSDEIGKIIKTIEEIAFQTNLLALNAAVEAARAGDAGKGFAVVADEVRNLAQRAGQAARDTAELIEGTVTRVKRGTDIVGRLRENFTHIEESTREITGLVGEITAASNEQAQGVDQVNTAVAQMDKVTQTNAANSEEAAAAAEELSAQAASLRGAVCDLSMLIGGDTEAAACDFRTLTPPGGGNRQLPGSTGGGATVRGADDDLSGEF